MVTSQTWIKCTPLFVQLATLEKSTILLFPLLLTNILHPYSLYTLIYGVSHLYLALMVTSSTFILLITIVSSHGFICWKTSLMHFAVFCNFKSQVELQLGHKIKSVQSDWEGEYRVFTELLKHNGIHHHISCPGAYQQNGTTERKHRHVVENGLTLRAQASMPFKFWDEAFRTSIYLSDK